MNISLDSAPDILDELVRRAENGEDIVLTLGGRSAVRLVPVNPISNKRARRAVALKRARGLLPRKDGPEDAARSQDFLYDEDGLPMTE